MRFKYAAAIFLMSLMLASCGGGGVEQLDTGQVSGSVSIIGPSNGAVELLVGVFPNGSNTPAQSSVAGRVTSTASLVGRTISYSFTDLEFGTYYIGVYAMNGPNPTFFYQSGTFTCSAQAQIVEGLAGQCSFSGQAPWGTISGVTSVEGTWPDPSLVTYIGISPIDNPMAQLQHLVSQSELNDGKLFYNMEGISYGTYLVGLFGYNPVTHEVTTYGAFDDPVVVNAASPNVATINFPSDFTGDPGEDPVLGQISGTVTLSDSLPAGLFYYIAANTIPPQAGSPPATYEIFEDQVQGNTIDYTLSFISDDTYSVSIFAYDIITHEATYFGEYDGTVTVSGGDSHSGIDFTADVSQLN